MPCFSRSGSSPSQLRAGAMSAAVWGQRELKLRGRFSGCRGLGSRSPPTAACHLAVTLGAELIAASSISIHGDEAQQEGSCRQDVPAVSRDVSRSLSPSRNCHRESLSPVISRDEILCKWGEGSRAGWRAVLGGLLRSHGLSPPFALPCSCVCRVNNIYVF